jgi:outer membrane protein assembly factor BamE (lipoprotein component of BamABCDE complex)
MKRTLILLSIFFLSCGNNNNAEKFNAEKWINGTQIERGNMSSDLVDSKILIGKTKIEIIELLGSPKDSSDVNFHYLVDFGFIVPFHLDINFSSVDNKAKEVKLAD